MNKFLLLLSAFLLLTLTNSTSRGQDQSNPMGPAETDQILQLGLTPEQRERIREIFQQNRDERQTTNRRVREANIALNQALDSEQIDEGLIEQRLNDVSSAQAAQLRLRIRQELQIRRELRPEQIAIWRSLRLHRDVMNGQRPLNRRVIRDVRPNRRSIVIPRRNTP